MQDVIRSTTSCGNIGRLMEKKEGNKGKLLRIKVATIATYSIVLIFILFTVRHIQSIREDILSQKAGIESQRKELKLTGQLAELVYLAQSEADLYVRGSDRYGSYRKFLSYRDSILILGDSLSGVSGDSSLFSQSEEIVKLLNEKIYNRRRLENILRSNPVDEISRTIQEIEDSSRIKPNDPDSSIVLRVIRDTIMQKKQNTTFWSRLKYAFSPKKAVDSIAYISTVKVDTIIKEKPDSARIISQIKERSEEASSRYVLKIDSLRHNINNLLADERVSSYKISLILTDLQNRSILSVENNLKLSEEKLDDFNRWSIVLACISFSAIVLLIILLIRSMTKLEKSNISLAEEKRHVTEIMEGRHSLLLNVSHDIKTPLSSITGYLSLMNDSKRSDELESMLSSAAYINALLNNLLKFTALNKGKLVNETVDTDIYASMEKIMKMFSTIATNKSSEIILKNSIPKGTHIMIDHLKTEQVIINVLSNAIKYGNRNPVTLETSVENGCFHFRVSDNGIGIRKEKLREIFDLFSRMDEGRTVSSGDGVGMYVVKGLVDVMGGKITLDSVYGEGTTVNITIPAETVSITSEEQETVSEEEGNDIQASHISIAVVDDDMTILHVIDQILKHAGITDRQCFSDYDDMELASVKRKFDIVITDLEMGEKSGYDILHLIRRCDSIRNCHTFMVTMTGRTDIDKSGLIDSGFNYVLHKPFSNKSVKMMLNAYTGNNAGNGKNTGIMTFHDMFKDDPESLSSVLHAFVESSSEGMKSIASYIAERDFYGAASVIHKLKPGFIQAGASAEITDFMERTDRMRNDKEEPDFEKWKSEALDFIHKASDFIHTLSDFTRI